MTNYPFMTSYASDTLNFFASESDLGTWYFRWDFTDDNTAGHDDGPITYRYYFAVIVKKPNYAPTIDVMTCDGIKLNKGDDPATCFLEASDPNPADTLSYSFLTSYSWVSFDDGVFSIAPDSGVGYGTYQVGLRVEDDNTQGYSSALYADTYFDVVIRNDANI